MPKVFRSLFHHLGLVFLAVLMTLTVAGPLKTKADNITVSASADLIDCRTVAAELNTWRAQDPVYKNISGTDVHSGHTAALSYDYALEEIAIQRAIEISHQFSHTRPDGTTCFTVVDSTGGTTNGENIAVGYATPSAAFEAWKEESEPYSGQGHRRNMLGVGDNGNDLGFVCFAMAGVKVNGRYYWAMEFRTVNKKTEATTLPAAKTVDLTIAESQIASLTLEGVESSVSVPKDQTFQFDLSQAKLKLVLKEESASPWGQPLEIFPLTAAADFSWTIADPSIATAGAINDRKLPLTGAAAGATTLSVKWLKAPNTAITPTVAVTVTARTVESIALSTPPTHNTIMIYGTLDPSGGKVRVRYDDASEQEIDLTAAMLTYDATKAGEQTATVTFGGKTTELPYLVVPQPETINAVYGRKLSELTLPTYDYGTFSWEDPNAYVGNVGTRAFTATFTPVSRRRSPATYTVLEGVPVPVAVAKANPSVPAQIEASAVYGQTLADVTLPAGDRGTYSFQQPLTTSVGNAGVHDEFTVSFTPDDTDNYNPVPGIRVKLTVAKADPVGRDTVNVTMPYGEMLRDYLPLSMLGYYYPTEEANVYRQFAVGTYDDITLVFIPNDEDNYHTITNIPLHLVVEKADPNIDETVFLTAEAGDTLADLTLPVLSTGTFSWQDPLTTSAGTSGTSLFTITFTPKDTANYNVLSDCTAVVMIGKKVPAYQIPQGLTAEVYSNLGDIRLPEGFRWHDPGQDVGGAGEKVFLADYTPQDEDTYIPVTNIEIPVTVVLMDFPSDEIQIPTGLTGLQGNKLSTVELPDDLEWMDPDQLLGAPGEHVYLARWINLDPDLFNDIENIEIKVTVKANPDLPATGDAAMTQLWQLVGTLSAAGALLLLKKRKADR